MTEKDTWIGGSHRSFPTTIWSDILSAGDPSSPEHKETLDRLLRAYWKPVYAYVRAAWRRSVEDAKDLTQAFFTRMLSKEYVSRLRPERGSFRGYLKRALKHFLIDMERMDAVRRPSKPMFSLDAAPGEFERLGPAAADEAPDQVYDRTWYRVLFDSSIEQLRRSLQEEDKSVYFEAFRFYCIEPEGVEKNDRSTAFLRDGPEPGPTYRDVAVKLEIQETDVRNYLTYCRRLLKDILRGRIREYVTSESDVELELEEVMRG